MELKLGILLPRSDMYPTLAKDIMNGIKLGLKPSSDNAVQPKYFVEGIGNASDMSVIKEAEKMLLQNDVDLTISFCGSHHLNALTDLFDAYKKPLIHVDLGGSILKKEMISPYVLHHTLNLWQSAYASGAYAAKKFGKKAAIAASFYDGGYNLTQSFVSGFTDNGGEIKSFYVGPMDYKSETFETMIQKVTEADPDVLFTMFSFKEGIKIFDILSRSKLNGKLPIIALPLMTDETINTENYKLDNVISIASWSFDETSNNMQSFNKGYESTYDMAPNIMSLLGFEIGLMITLCMQQNERIPNEIGAFFKSQHLESPRGTLRCNDHHETMVNSFKIRKFNFNKVKYHNTVIDTMDLSNIEELYERFEMLPFSSWKNPYICT